MTSENILFVDDDQNMLSAFQRQLKSKFNIDVALGGVQGLEKIKNGACFAVVVSDLRMPGLDGIQFLSKVKELAPDTVRVILTGYANLKTTIQAINDINIFKFLTKPCPPQILSDVLQSGILQFNQTRSEHDTVEHTLNGCITVLTKVLSLVNPEASGRSLRIKQYAVDIARILEVPDIQQIETAVLLSQLGCLAIPEETLKKIRKGQSLNEEENNVYVRHPSIASELLSHLPRLQKINKIIACQDKPFDGSGQSSDKNNGLAIPIEARILKVVLDFDILKSAEVENNRAVRSMKERPGTYDPEVLAAFEKIIADGISSETTESYEIREITLKDLCVSMILEEDVRSFNGTLLISKGQDVNNGIVERLTNYSLYTPIQEPIRVRVPK